MESCQQDDEPSWAVCFGVPNCVFSSVGKGASHLSPLVCCCCEGGWPTHYSARIACPKLIIHICADPLPQSKTTINSPRPYTPSGSYLLEGTTNYLSSPILTLSLIFIRVTNSKNRHIHSSFFTSTSGTVTNSNFHTQTLTIVGVPVTPPSSQSSDCTVWCVPAFEGALGGVQLLKLQYHYPIRFLTKPFCNLNTNLWAESAWFERVCAKFHLFLFEFIINMFDFSFRFVSAWLHFE